MQQILDACADLPEVAFAAGETLLEESAAPGKLYVLISGEVVVLKGATEITRIAEPGAIFGEISALLGIPYTASVRALGPVRARLSESADDFIASNPVVALHAARVLARRLHAATAYLADIKTQFAEHENHFGMMDRILDTLLHRQAAKAPEPRTSSDPRL